MHYLCKVKILNLGLLLFCCCCCCCRMGFFCGRSLLQFEVCIYNSWSCKEVLQLCISWFMAILLANQHSLLQNYFLPTFKNQNNILWKHFLLKRVLSIVVAFIFMFYSFVRLTKLAILLILFLPIIRTCALKIELKTILQLSLNDLFHVKMQILCRLLTAESSRLRNWYS